MGAVCRKTWSFFGRQRNHQYRQKVLCALISNWTSTVQAPDEFIKPPETWREELQELMTLLTEHYNPAPTEIVERYKFHMRMRHKGETVSTLVAELHSLARYCKFGASLNDLL